MLRAGPLLGIATLLLGAGGAAPQSEAAYEPQTDAPYKMTVTTREVNVTFHAADQVGLPIENLEQWELKLADNGRAPEKIVSLDLYKDLPVRGGIVIDKSASIGYEMQGYIQKIAALYVAGLFRRETDKAFVTLFDFENKVVQDWTSDPAALQEGLRGRHWDSYSRMGGSAIFDTLYRTCRDQFVKSRDLQTGNFILLFSDGEDNASHAEIRDVTDECQLTHTAIYVFVNQGKSIFNKPQAGLRELVERTGGRIFYAQDDRAIREGLQTMVSDLRTQYRVIYRPRDFKLDGSFHTLKLSCVRCARMVARSGYYAEK